MPGGKLYPPETKARAIAALTAGATPRSVSEDYGIPLATARSWRDDLRRAAIIAPHEKQRDVIGELVFGYLHEVITTLQTQARFARDESWLRQQNAHDVAILHGVLTDKAIRLLSALEPTDADARVIDLVAPADVPVLHDGTPGEPP